MTLTIAPVPSLNLNVGYPVSPMAMYAAQSSAISIYCTGVQGAIPSPLAVSLTGLPAGATATLSSKVMPLSGSIYLQVTTASNIDVAAINLTLTVSGGAFSRSVPIAIPVMANNFVLTTSQKALTIKQASSGQVTSTTTHLAIFNKGIVLSWSGLPSGMTAALSQSSFAAPGDGSAVTTFSVAPTVKTGNYTATLTAIGGTIVQTVPVTVTVASK